MPIVVLPCRSPLTAIIRSPGAAINPGRYRCGHFACEKIAVRERIESDPIGKLRRVRHVPYRQIRPQPGSDSAGVVESERPRRLARGAGERLLGGQAKERARHVHRDQQGGEGRRAGVAVRRDRHRHPVPAKELHRRVPRRMQGIGRSGEEHRDRPRLRERAHPVLGDVLEMVGGERAMPRGEAGAAQIGELFGVKLHRQPQRAGALEHALDLGRGEGDALAEAVHRIDEGLRMGGLQGRHAHLVEIGVGAARVLGRDGVGAEEAGAHPDRPFGGDAARGAQHGELRLDVQTVADLISMAQTPSAISASTRGRAQARSASGSVFRVASTVEKIPPPARATSS